MLLKRNLKILGLYLVSAYGAFVFAQSQPQADGMGVGSTGANSVSATRTTTNSTTTGTTGGMGVGTTDQVPSDISTVDPMDPSRDSRTGSDATMGNARNRRAMGTTSSGTTVPGSTTTPRF